MQWVKKNGERGKRAFSSLVGTHQSSVLRILEGLLSRADAKDASQEAFFIAYKSIGNLRDDSKFGAWVRSIAVRTAYRVHRRQRRYETVEFLENGVADEAGQLDSVAMREALQVCLRKLPFIYREVMVLRYVEELTYQEVAETLDISVPAAKMRVKRARDNFIAIWPHETSEPS